MYIDKFFNSNKSRITPWDKSVHVILMQAPNVVKQDKEKGKFCNWLNEGEDTRNSKAMNSI